MAATVTASAPTFLYTGLALVEEPVLLTVGLMVVTVTALAPTFIPAGLAIIEESVTFAWRSFGLEIVIFLATMTCATILKRMGNTPLRVKKRCQVIDQSDFYSEKPHKEKRLDHRAAAPHQRRILPNTGAEPLRAPKELVTVRGTGVREVAHSIDAIVKGIAESSTPSRAIHALKVYADLRVSLKENGLLIMEAAPLCKHKPEDFYRTMVQCAMRGGRPEMIDEIITDMISQGVPRSLAFYESAMKQIAGQKLFQLALKIYDRLAADGLEPSPVTYSCLVRFAAEVGELNRAVNFFEKLSATSTTPSIRAYMSVLRVHAKRKDWAASLELLRNMQARGVKVDSLVLNIVLATAVAADQIEAAEALLKEADAHGPPFSDVVSHNTLIKGYSQRRDVTGAELALRRMMKRGLAPNGISFNTAMDAAVRAQKVDAAWRMLDQMREAGHHPDKFTCSIMVKGLAQCPTSEGAVAALALLRQAGGSADVALQTSMYNTVLDTLTKANNHDVHALAVAQMRQAGLA